MIAIKNERTQVHFLSDVFVLPPRRWILKSLLIFSVERTRCGLNIFSKTESGEHTVVYLW